MATSLEVSLDRRSCLSPHHGFAEEGPEPDGCCASERTCGRPTWALPHSRAAIACSCPPASSAATRAVRALQSTKMKPTSQDVPGCCGAAAPLPHPRGGDRGSSVSSAPRGGRTPQLSPWHILVIQIRSCHKGEGPAPNKKPLGAARGDRRGLL